MTQGDMRELISGYFDDVLDDVELEQLSQWIQRCPENAEEFAKAAMLHDRLQSELYQSPEIAPTPAERPQSARPQGTRPFALLAGIAASVLLILGIWYAGSDNPAEQIAETDTDRHFASIARVVDVSWSGGEMLSMGNRISEQTIRIPDGIVGIEFDDGVEVTLEGPAEYELIGLGKTRLHSGVLSATVPPGAEGFRVETPTAHVTDLGTAFGIRLDEGGGAEVTVFDGEVDVTDRDSQQQRLLKEGEAVRIATDQSIESMEFDTKPFEKLWPISSGIAGSTGAFEFRPPWPRRIRFLADNDTIFVLPEGYRTEIQAPLDLNISSPGLYANKEDLTPRSLQAGTPIRSFLLHFLPEQGGPGARIDGSITFDRPVLGLIVLHKELAASRQLLRARGVETFNDRRQLELNGGSLGDSVELSEDRRTVSLSLSVPRRFPDMVRVILDGSKPASAQSR